MEPGFAVPILPARDLKETRTFYESLAFVAVGWWPSEFGGYAILKRGDLEMHFFSYADLSPQTNYAGCYWRVHDLEALHAGCLKTGLPAAGTPRLTAIDDKPWGMREFALVDPNGNLIRVGQRSRS